MRATFNEAHFLKQFPCRVDDRNIPNLAGSLDECHHSSSDWESCRTTSIYNINF